jgi:TRAP-type C4-dicarboxylate transport system permease small subunit
VTDEPEDEGPETKGSVEAEPSKTKDADAEAKDGTSEPEAKAKAADAKADDAKADDAKADDAKADADAKPETEEGKPRPKAKADKAGDGVPVGEADIPATRKQDALDPAPRPSQVDLRGHLTYPDDGPLSKKVRRLDNLVGMVEQVVLVTILAAVVLTAASHALLDRFAHIHVPFKDDVIRAGTFAMAMLAGPFASHQAKHLSMDLISRRLSPRARLFLKVALSLFIMFVVVLLIRSGLHNIHNEEQFAQEDKLISRVRIAWLIPIGGAMIIFHTILHTIIDVDYIARRKTPPERMRSGH